MRSNNKSHSSKPNTPSILGDESHQTHIHSNHNATQEGSVSLALSSAAKLLATDTTNSIVESEDEFSDAESVHEPTPSDPVGQPTVLEALEPKRSRSTLFSLFKRESSASESSLHKSRSMPFRDAWDSRSVLDAALGSTWDAENVKLPSSRSNRQIDSLMIDFTKQNAVDASQPRIKGNLRSSPGLTHMSVLQELSLLPNVADRRMGDKNIVEQAANPCWTMQFCPNGIYLAAGGNDGVLVVWKTTETSNSPDDAIQNSSKEPSDYDQSDKGSIHTDSHDSPSKPKTKGMHHSSSMPLLAIAFSNSRKTATDSSAALSDTRSIHSQSMPNRNQPLFESSPFRVYKSHSQAITSISWSTNGFIATGSLDKTARLWHISHQDLLCEFRHPDCVTSVCFNPKDDGYFATGCLDGRIRLWSIADKKVKFWNEIHGGLISTVTFSADGRSVLCGTMQGDCVFYETQDLKYNTQIHVPGSSALRNNICKITGITSMPFVFDDDEERFLITSTDSKIRVFNSRDKSLQNRYRGVDLKSSNLCAHVSEDGKYIVCGSEDKRIFIWDVVTSNDGQQANTVLGGIKQWQQEVAKTVGVARFTASEAPLSVVVFAPDSLCRFATSIQQTIDETGERETNIEDDSNFIIASADVHGKIRIMRAG